MNYYESIAEGFHEEKQVELHDIFEAAQFKLNRNRYHFQNIKNIIEKSSNVETLDYYEDIYLPLYYEMESILVSLRSSVDMFLHLINNVFDFGLVQNDVNLYNIYHHKQLPQYVKNIFNRFTRPYNNPVWNFIYSARNDIVHEKSVNQVIPVNIDLFSSETPIVLLTWDGQEKEMISFFNQALKLLDNFGSELIQAVRISI